jgi:ATP-dependent DNA helicase MPH1
MAWLIDDDDDGPDIEIVDSSPVTSRRQPPVGSATDDDSIEFVEPPVSPSKYGNRSSSAEPNNLIKVARSPKVVASRTKPREHSNHSVPNGGRSDDIEVVSDSNSSDKDMAGSPTYQSSLRPSYQRIKHPCRASLSPVIQPRLSESEQDIPDLSFPVRPVANQRKRHRVEPEESSSPVLDMPPPSQRRIHRRRESSPVQRGSRKQNDSNLNSRFNPLFDFAAIHSGDETSEGSSDPENDVEDESDRLFLQQMPETQLSPSYDQTLAYRQSLFTQAPAGSKAPVFANRPVRQAIFRNADTSSRRGRFVPSSPSNGEPDEYAFGSFVVDDEAEISYLSSD